MHKYVDQSDLNAMYDQMALRGLGAHEYLDTSNLNAPYDYSPPFNMVGSGILANTGLGSLGATSLSYPWRQESADTRELQRVLNVTLRDSGRCPIAEDGVLGPGTCGAARFVIDELGISGQSPPATCESFSAPGRPPCGGGTTPSPPTPSDTELVAPRRSGAGMGSDTLWLVGGFGVATLLIGGAIVMKKKRRGR